MMRFYQQENKSYFIASIQYNIIISISIFIILLLNLLLCKFVEIDDPVFISLILLGTIGRGLINFIQDYVRISKPNLNQYTIVSIVSNAFYYFPPIILLIINSKISVEYLLIVQVTGIFIYLLFYIFPHIGNIIRLTKKIETKIHYTELLNYGFPLLVSYLSISMFVRVDRYIIEHNVGLEALGIYSAAFSLSNLAISSFFMLLTLPTYPEMLRLFNQGNDREAKIIYNNNGNLIIVVAVPLVIIACLMSQQLCSLFFGAGKGIKIAVLFPWVVLGTFLYNYKVHYFDQIFQFFKKTKVSMQLGIAVGLSHIVLAYILSMIYGAKGVAISGILLNAGAIIFIYFFSRSFFRITLNRKIFLWLGMACVLLFLLSNYVL